jgi:hypothetical protein
MNTRTRFITFAAIVFSLAPIRAQAVQFGWQQLPDGGIEYMVQVEPELLDTFRQSGFTSDVPAGLQRDLRRIRITVGNQKLPNEGDVMGPKDNTPNTPAGPTASVQPAAPSSGTSMLDRLKSVVVSPWEKSASKPAPADSAPSTSATLDLPPPPSVNETQAKTEPPPLVNETHAHAEPRAREAPQPLSSLPFFQSGQVSKIDNGKSSGESQTSTPRLNENEGAQDSPRLFGSDRMSMSAKPAVLETPVGGGAAPSSAPIAKPWLPLMGALLALFASVGANVYLGWIYQSVRLKYRTLAARVGSSVAGA